MTSTTVGGVFNTLSYDANGAVIRYDIAGTTEDKWLAYNVANQPTKIVIGSSLTDTTPQVSEEFRYDPDGHRYARQSSWQEGGVTHQEHVSYVGNVEVVNDTSNGEILWVYKTRLSPSVMHVKAEWLGLIDGQPRSWNESHFEYAHRDHLGSIELVTDDSGAELHRLARYDPGAFVGERGSAELSNDGPGVGEIDPDVPAVAAGAAATTADGILKAESARRLLAGLRALAARLSAAVSMVSIGGSTPQNQYIHYGYAAQSESFTGGLRPGSYASRPPLLSGGAAQQLLALPHSSPPDAYYLVTAPNGVPIIGPTPVAPTEVPPRTGGGVEYLFPSGTPPGTVSGPFPLPLGD